MKLLVWYYAFTTIDGVESMEYQDVTVLFKHGLS